jgi:hypothetical protein
MENYLYKQVRLKKQKSLFPDFVAVLLLCSLEGIAWAGHSISQSVAPNGWPTRLDKRTLYSSEYGFVYAGSKSAAVHVNKLVGAVVKELDENDKKKTTKGLILVMDTKEKPLLDLQKMIEVVREADKHQESEESKNVLKSADEIEDKLEKQGLDMGLLLSIVPIPIEPNLLPEIVGEFPEDLDQQIDFCVIVPTERNIRSGMKKILKAAMKKKKIGLMERMVIFPLMPFIEQMVVDSMKKGRQLVLYELLLDQQKGLTEKQKEDKINAYKRRLGLAEDADSNRDAENIDARLEELEKLRSKSLISDEEYEAKRKEILNK